MIGIIGTFIAKVNILRKVNWRKFVRGKSFEKVSVRMRMPKFFEGYASYKEPSK